MNATTKGKPKDVNSVTQTRLTMIAMRIAPVCALLGWMIGGLQGVIIALPGSILAAFAVELLSGGLGGGSVNILYSTGRLDRSMRDQFIGTLSQARFHKMSRRQRRYSTKQLTIPVNPTEISPPCENQRTCSMI